MVVASQIVSFSIAPLLTPFTSVTITVSVSASIQGAANVSLAVDNSTSSVVPNARSFNSTVAQKIVFTAPSASPAVIFVSFVVSGSDATVFYTPAVIAIPVLALASNSLRMTVDTPSQTLLAGVSETLSTNTLTFTPSQPVLDPAQPLVVYLSSSAGTLSPSMLIFTPRTTSLSVSLVTPLAGPSVTITATSRAAATIKYVKFAGGDDMGRGLSSLTSNPISLASKDFTFWSDMPCQQSHLCLWSMLLFELLIRALCCFFVVCCCVQRLGDSLRWPDRSEHAQHYPQHGPEPDEHCGRALVPGLQWRLPHVASHSRH